MQLADATFGSSYATTTGTSSDLDDLELLRRHDELEMLAGQDDPLHWEEPANFDRARALSTFRRFVSDLEDALSHRLDYDAFASLDDARFHGEIFLAGGPLRFSNFGRMVAFVEGKKTPAALRAAVTRICRAHGYTLLDDEVLETPYSGKNPRLSRGGSWLTRYFF
jgi:hypothetical protein